MDAGTIQSIASQYGVSPSLAAAIAGGQLAAVAVVQSLVAE